MENIQKSEIKEPEKMDELEEFILVETPKDLVESIGERKCREVLERIYGKPFVNIRPHFLKNPVTGKNLELDCYNAELKIAVEYHGIQHYVYTEKFHKNYGTFREQKYRDLLKKDLCERAGVSLIEPVGQRPRASLRDVVPYKVSIGEIERFLRDELRKRDLLPVVESLRGFIQDLLG